MEQRYYLWALCALMLSVAAQDIVTFPTNIEVDILLPRNQTYAPVAPFPIIFAIQNAQVAWNFGFHLDWELRAGTTSSSGLDDFGFLSISSIVETEVAPADPYIFVNSTSSPSIYGITSGDLRTWTLTWTMGFYSNCTDHGDTFEIQSIDHNVGGSIEFSTEAGGIIPDLVAASQSTDGCPLLGGLIQLQSNLTGCPHIGDSGIPANPCAVNVEQVARSISDALVPTTTGGIKPTSTSTSAPTSAPSNVSTGQETETGASATTGSSPEATQSNHASAPNQKEAILALGIAALAIVV